MANNVYIGNRYVPLMDGDWVNNKTYNPLTIVTYGNNSYTSKKPVPLNTPPTSGDEDDPYWALTGNYNGQIAALNNRLTSAEGRIGDIETELTESHYAVFIGDSYTAASSLGTNYEMLRFSARLCGMLGLIEKNYASGGVGIVHGSPNYQTQIDSAVSDFTSNNLDKTLVDYVFVCGNRNDFGDSSITKTAYVNGVKHIHDTAAGAFTKAKIVWIPALYDASYMGQQYLQFTEWIKEAITSWDHKNVVIDDAYTWMTGFFEHILYQNGANVHWDGYGHMMVAGHIYSAIMGNNFTNDSWCDLQPTFNGSYINSSTSKVHIYKENNIVRIRGYIKPTAQTSGTTTLFSKASSALYFAPYYIGDQRIYFTMETRGISHPEPKCFIEFSHTKTGDTTGSFNITCALYAGNLFADEQYMLNLDIPLGVTNRAANYT